MAFRQENQTTSRQVKVGLNALDAPQQRRSGKFPERRPHRTCLINAVASPYVRKRRPVGRVDSNSPSPHRANKQQPAGMTHKLVLMERLDLPLPAEQQQFLAEAAGHRFWEDWLVLLRQAGRLLWALA